MNSSKTLKNGTIRDSKLRSETDKTMLLKNVEKKKQETVAAIKIY